MKSLKTDILVIGSGIAGLSFALRAAEIAKVTVVTKKELVESNTNYAQGGIASVQRSDDSFKLHVKDTLKAGDGLCNEAAVDILVKHGPKEIQRLLKLGVGFKQVDGKLVLTQEGGHTKRRIAFVHDRTGKEIEQTLAFHCRNHKNITLLEEHIGVDLITRQSSVVSRRSQIDKRPTTNDKHCLGAFVLDISNNKLKTITAKVTVLASGGYGQVFQYTSNPKIATGDGVAMAFRAGAMLTDMEFVQFHPTTFDKKGFPHYLISETVRGEGAFLLNAKKQRFMKKVHPDAELATRDIVSRAIIQELKKGPVYLDIRHKGEAYLKDRFPGIYEQLWWYGIKMERDLIPVAPAAHYCCGGIKTDTWGRTNLENLYAFGEVAGTGVHGANRLASNSLLESVVFAGQAFVDIRNKFRKGLRATSNERQLPVTSYSLPSNAKRRVNSLRATVRKIMWDGVGVVREGKKLSNAMKRLAKLADEAVSLRKKYLSAETIELENLATVGWLTAIAALGRQESRGGHFRADFPKRDDKQWKKHIYLRLTPPLRKL